MMWGIALMCILENVLNRSSRGDFFIKDKEKASS